MAHRVFEPSFSKLVQVKVQLKFDKELSIELTLAEILTSNSVGTQLFFLGCNQDNNPGSNFINKKKICLVLPEKEISNHRN